MAIQVSRLTPVETTPVETQYRRIRTAIPVPESIDLIERLRKVEPRSMLGMPPVVWEQAEGFLIRDPYGNQWIDLTSGIVMANSGHAHPRVIQAIRDQLESQLIFSYAFPTRVPRAGARTPGRDCPTRTRQSHSVFLRDRSHRMLHQPDAKTWIETVC